MTTVTALVLTFDRYRAVTGHMIQRYRDLWPEHPYRFRVPFQTEAPGQSNRDVEYIRSPAPIKATVLTMIADLDDEDLIYWCIDDKYPIALDVPRIESIHRWVTGDQASDVGGVLFCRSRGMLKSHNLTGAGIDGPDGERLLERKNYRQIWFHQYLRVKVLRHLFKSFPDVIEKARMMDRLKSQVAKPAGHRIYVTEGNHAVYGESTVSGKLTRNCYRSLVDSGLALPSWHDKPVNKEITMGCLASPPTARQTQGPDFLGLGAQRAGTSWTFRHLSKHPEIGFPAGKEVQFWSWKRKRGLDWYAGKFSGDGTVQGDISPAYAILPLHVIEQCHRAYPDLKLIFIVRDKIERTWSASVRTAAIAGLDPANLPDDWYLAEFEDPRALQRSDYETCISNWLTYYPPESMLILHHREIRDNPAGFLKKIARHLNVSGGFFDSIPEEAFREPVNRSPKLAIRPALSRHLETVFPEPLSSAKEAESLLETCSPEGEPQPVFLREFSTNGPRNLHLGCGRNVLAGWLNTDAERTADDMVLHLDPFEGIGFADASVDRIFTSKGIELKEYQSGARMLRECFRVLKPGGRIRICTPDFAHFVRLYCDPEAKDCARYLNYFTQQRTGKTDLHYSLFVINQLLKERGLRFHYDEALLTHSLTQAGFEEITRYEAGESGIGQFRGIENESRLPEGLLRLESLVMEAVKPGSS